MNLAPFFFVPWVDHAMPKVLSLRKSPHSRQHSVRLQPTHICLVTKPPARTVVVRLRWCCSRVVEAIADGEKYLQLGDTVVSQFDQNWGGLAEYALAKSSNCIRNPPACLSPAEAAATASSGASAVAISRHVKRGDRVLVIGGSGGVGTFLVQLARARGASFVAAVSTQSDLMRDLGVDKAIDYREEDVWASAEFQAEGGQFDIIFDLVEKGWDRVISPEGRARPIIKTARQGGRFVTTVRNGVTGGLLFGAPSLSLWHVQIACAEFLFYSAQTTRDPVRFQTNPVYDVINVDVLSRTPHTISLAAVQSVDGTHKKFVDTKARGGKIGRVFTPESKYDDLHVVWRYDGNPTMVLPGL